MTKAIKSILRLLLLNGLLIAGAVYISTKVLLFYIPLAALGLMYWGVVSGYFDRIAPRHRKIDSVGHVEKII